MQKDIWKPGETAWFEYHCWMSHNSADAQLWYRSQQQVEILRLTDCEVTEELDNFNKRTDAGMPWVYTIKFADGFIGDAFEDELLTDPKHFNPTFKPPQNRRRTWLNVHHLLVAAISVLNAAM